MTCALKTGNISDGKTASLHPDLSASTLRLATKSLDCVFIFSVYDVFAPSVNQYQSLTERPEVLTSDGLSCVGRDVCKTR